MPSEQQKAQQADTGSSNTNEKGAGDDDARWWWNQQSYDFRSRVMYFSFSAFIALFLALLFAQLLAFDRSAERPRETAVVFTDGDVDDLLALHYLLRRSDVAVPLVVVSGNGVASPRAALDNVRRFVELCQAQQQQQQPQEEAAAAAAGWDKTRVVLGSSLALRDCGGASSNNNNARRCTYSRFTRSSLAIRVGADTLYGKANALQKLVGGEKRQNSGTTTTATTQQQSAQQLFSSLVAGALKGGTKLSLVLLGPATDAEKLIRTAIPDRNTARDVLRVVVMAGGKFTTSSKGGVADAAIIARDTSHEVGAEAEFNFFADPEAATEIISGSVFAKIPASTTSSSSTTTSDDSGASSSLVVPVVVVPADVSGSNAAYVDFHDQWATLTRKQQQPGGDPVQQFLASLLESFAAFEGKTFFPFKGTPKSVAAVSVLLDRVVRNSVYTSIVDSTTSSNGNSNSAAASSLAVLGWDYVTQIGASLSTVGRSGMGSSSNTGGGGGGGNGDNAVAGAVVEVAVGFANGASPRIFMDSYLRVCKLPWRW